MHAAIKALREKADKLSKNPTLNFWKIEAIYQSINRIYTQQQIINTIRAYEHEMDKVTKTLL